MTDCVNCKQHREHIERLEAKIGRLAISLAELEVKLYGERPKGSRAGLTGEVRNPGDPGWKRRAH
jgi:hypothetical protein